jgi:hypothetical protein
MNLSEIFYGKNPLESTDLRKSFLNKIQTEAEQDNADITRWFGVAESYYHGFQQFDIHQENADNHADQILYNPKTGNPVYGNLRDLGVIFDEDDDRRSVNLIKSYVDSMVSKFCEVKPLPIATKVPYVDNPDTEEKIEKVNCVMDMFFYEENDFKSLYEIACRDAMIYRHSVLMVDVDYEHAKTKLPFKIRNINPKDLAVDPYARSLEEADYLIHTIRMRKVDMDEKFWYELKPNLETGKTKESTMSDMDSVDIHCYWLRLYDPTKKTTKWMSLYVYENVWLMFKDKNGKPIKEKSKYLFETHPFVLFYTQPSKFWWGETSMVMEVADTQTEYNNTKSDEKRNWNMTVDPPFKGTIDPNKVKSGRQPGGYIPIDNKKGEFYERDAIPVIGTDTLVYRSQDIKSEMNLTFGNTQIMEGGRPTGVYANKMLQTIVSLNEVKPKKIESLFLLSVRKLSEKFLKLLSEWLPSSGMEIYSERRGMMIDVAPEDIDNVLYKIDIAVTDANLMTPQAKVESLTSIMQYTPTMEQNFSNYQKAMLYNSALPGLIPDEVMVELEKEHVANKELKQRQVVMQGLEMEVATLNLMLQKARLEQQAQQIGVVLPGQDDPAMLQNDQGMQQLQQIYQEQRNMLIDEYGDDPDVIDRFDEIYQTMVKNGEGTPEEMAFRLVNEVVPKVQSIVSNFGEFDMGGELPMNNMLNLDTAGGNNELQ